MDTLITPRLILRGFTPYDAPALFEYARNPHVGPNAGWKPHASLAESQHIVDMFIREEQVWAITLLDSGRLIGSIGLEQNGTHANPAVRAMGYALDEAYWGFGYATEAARRVLAYAFEVKGLDLVSICHYPFNDRSRRVIEKCGFRYEGTLRRAVRLYDGRVTDRCMYSITKEEYKEQRNGKD